MFGLWLLNFNPCKQRVKSFDKKSFSMGYAIGSPGNPPKPCSVAKARSRWFLTQIIEAIFCRNILMRNHLLDCNLQFTDLVHLRAPHA